MTFSYNNNIIPYSKKNTDIKYRCTPKRISNLKLYSSSKKMQLLLPTGVTLLRAQRADIQKITVSFMKKSVLTIKLNDIAIIIHEKKKIIILLFYKDFLIVG